MPRSPDLSAGIANRALLDSRGYQDAARRAAQDGEYARAVALAEASRAALARAALAWTSLVPAAPLPD